ncbi:hypothetical protein Pla110_28760 [Polystyrenella longa]|uniref:Uncharacterized protein n=1 Tax=Polystyrenella longa TaxID=2528007 RepID=A0A518CPI7_9PLAN|nr:hypothetical protein Pla110_28760 [Polystyrenella longa]
MKVKSKAGKALVLRRQTHRRFFRLGVYQAESNGPNHAVSPRPRKARILQSQRKNGLSDKLRQVNTALSVKKQGDLARLIESPRPLPL